MTRYGVLGQPYSAEARDFLTGLVEGKRGYIVIHRKDIYFRPVATVFVREGMKSDHVGLRMVQAGFACVYDGPGKEYGGYEDQLRSAEKKAKKKRIGMWLQGVNYVSPADFKRKSKGNNNGKKTNFNFFRWIINK